MYQEFIVSGIIRKNILQKQRKTVLKISYSLKNVLSLTSFTLIYKKYAQFSYSTLRKMSVFLLKKITKGRTWLKEKTNDEN